MNDVSQHDNFLRLIIALQFLQARQRVGRWSDGHELSRQAMGPGIPKVKVGNGENTLVWKPRRPTVIEDDIVTELKG
jgi:hypothetical protein